ncbi:hypothetical protein KSS87_009707 [Heliosperma pusillum]|nr:hypothetical protein KSS87_009707 [Heliosperma pusillum]
MIIMNIELNLLKLKLNHNNSNSFKYNRSVIAPICINKTLKNCEQMLPHY